MNTLRGRNLFLPVCNLEAVKLLSFMAFMTEGQLLRLVPKQLSICRKPIPNKVQRNPF